MVLECRTWVKFYPRIFVTCSSCGKAGLSRRDRSDVSVSVACAYAPHRNSVTQRLKLQAAAGSSKHRPADSNAIPQARIRAVNALHTFLESVRYVAPIATPHPQTGALP
jgi:hypothetical protein